MNAARDEQVRALLPVVRSIARRVHRMVPSCELDDLIGDGCVGLVRAVDAFDPARGVPLEKYARRLILGAVLNGVRRQDPVPERLRRTLRTAEKARYALAQELGMLPTPVAMERMMPALAHARTEAYRRNALSLDTTLPRSEHMEPDHAGDPQSIAIERLERECMRRAIDALPRRQRSIVLAHYVAEQPLRALVGPLNISPQRVSQLHLLAVARLRADLAASAGMTATG
ncbi:MAG: sigma-70 family RNA polymerase sigma factor [Candidatus Eremiobacteraeota bacterium]|nr:sigma-70 family RNA polymerase sigma factor [Candidatus Eremiobacteraeota bacterium]